MTRRTTTKNQENKYGFFDVEFGKVIILSETDIPRLEVSLPATKPAGGVWVCMMASLSSLTFLSQAPSHSP